MFLHSSITDSLGFSPPLLLSGLCSETPRGRWTRMRASPLCTGRTATSCPTMTCWSCWLILESESRLCGLLTVWKVSKVFSRKENVLPPLLLLLHLLLHLRPKPAFSGLRRVWQRLNKSFSPGQAWEDGQAARHPGEPRRHHRQCSARLDK